MANPEKKTSCSQSVSAFGCAGRQSGTDASGSLETISLMVGTAGHIDHGKTALVRFLTGCDTDTLPEEKARGMTIDLGYATCVLPNSRRVGIVDVPGHERFVHNMVAGATGIDVVMLVVAADDGIMPQTIEHFHIVRLLGVTSGFVALTKIDIVSPERVAEVTAAIEEMVIGSFLEDRPIVPISSKTGQGFEHFYDVFVSTVDKTARRDASGAFRMHVERSFIVQGIGTIVSGIARSGIVRAGDDVEVLPAGTRKKVRGVQVFGVDAKEGRAGECVALKLGDVSHDEIRRGLVLATPGYFTPTRFVNAKLHFVPNLSRGLKPRTGIRLHIGTTDVPGYLVLPESANPAPGSETYVQLQLREPVVAAPGDFFVVRMLSPVVTLGGGNVVSPDSVKMRRSKADWVENVQEQEKTFRDPRTSLAYALEQAAGKPMQLAELAKAAFVSEETARQTVQEMVQGNEVVDVRADRYVHVAALKAAEEEVVRVLEKMHAASPLSVGFQRKDVLPELKADRLVLDKVLADMLERGTIRQTPPGLQLPARAPKLQGVQAAIADKIVNIYRRTGFASPRQEELPDMAAVPAAAIKPVFDFLVQTGQLVIISDKVVLHRELVELSRRKLIEYIKANGTIESGVFKDVLQTSRKYSIPLLEYWDAKGLTKRLGNERVLRETQQGG
ncbi:MAG: selenocysteine-specific translation elongation factor [Verrucomicrobia bacterium]|nr:selenocysteine-specific translation elongation factor [Verrucomicrobiota bacterium]